MLTISWGHDAQNHLRYRIASSDEHQRQVEAETANDGTTWGPWNDVPASGEVNRLLGHISTDPSWRNFPKD